MKYDLQYESVVYTCLSSLQFFPILVSGSPLVMKYTVLTHSFKIFMQMGQLIR